MGAHSLCCFFVKSLLHYFSIFETTKNNKYVQQQCLRQPCKSTPLSVTMSTVDDVVAADDEPEPEDFLVAEGELDSSDLPIEGYEPSERYQHAVRMQETRTEFRRHDKDTGSPEYQVAGMTERITYLTAHLKSNPKDFST